MENIIFVEDHEATLEIRVGKECFFCTGNHPLKKCEAFKKQSVDGRWQTVNEELQTMFIGVESLMNSRPLTALSDDPNDEPVLTLNHLLIGQMGSDLV